MTQEKQNELIVNLLDGKRFDDYRIDGVDYAQYDIPASFPIKLSDPDMFGMKRTGYCGFNSQWDWQIPAWAKVVPLIKEIATNGTDQDYKDYTHFLDQYENAVCSDNVKAGLLVLVKAIQWYNTVNK